MAMGKRGFGRTMWAILIVAAIALYLPSITRFLSASAS